MKTILLFWLAFAWSLTAYAQSSDNRIVEGAYFPNAYVQKNYLKNPTCDKNINDITKTGSSTLSTSATGKIKGAKSCNFNATASTETLTWAAFTQEQELYGRNCEAGFTYTGDGSLYKAYVKQGSTQVTVDQALTSVTTVSKRVVMNFPCGDISTAPTVVIEATGDGAAIIVDDVYYGLATNLSTASVDTEWTSATITSSLTTNATTTAFKRRVGDTVEYDVATVFSGVNTQAQYTLTLVETMDTAKIASIAAGTSVLGTAVYYDATGSGTGRLLGDVRYSSTNVVTVTTVDDSSASGHFLDNINSNTGVPVTVASGDKIVVRFSVPVAGWTASTVVKQEIAGWFVDANISGTNPALGTSAQTAYVTPNSASLTLTTNTNSAPVGVSCSSTNDNASLLSTCAAGSEEPGITFNVPSAGTYEVCSAFTHTVTDSGSGTNQGAEVTWQLAETANGSQTITQEGKSRIESGMAPGSAGGGEMFALFSPLHVCGTFNFSAGRKTVRLMYEQVVTGTPSTNAIIADGGTSNGQRDIHMTVRPWITAQNAPMLVGSVIARDNTMDVTTVNTIVSKSANYTATTQDETIVFTADATLTLGAAANLKGKKYIVMSSGTGTDVTIDGNASETICGATTVMVTGDKDKLVVQSDGTNWVGDNCFRTVVSNINCDAGSAITTQVGNWISSVGNIASGACAITMVTGIFSTAPHCEATNIGATPLFLSFSSAITTTAAALDCAGDGTASCASYDAYYECVGPR